MPAKGVRQHRAAKRLLALVYTALASSLAGKPEGWVRSGVLPGCPSAYLWK